MNAGVVAGLVGTVVGALIGFGGTWLSGWQQAKVAARERRADAYIQALVALQRERQMIQRTSPIFGPVADPPSPLTDEAAALGEALLAGHASSSMRRLLDDWISLRARFFAFAGELEDARREGVANADFARQQGISLQEASGNRLPSAIWRDLVKARKDLIGDADSRGVLGAIEAQVRKELGYRD